MNKSLRSLIGITPLLGCLFSHAEENSSPTTLNSTPDSAQVMTVGCRQSPAVRPSRDKTANQVKCKHPLYYKSSCPVGFDLTLALDDFRDIPSGSWKDSFGALTAANLTVPLPCSFSTQLAGSYGLYEWAGRSSTPFKNSKTYQQQGFLTIAASWQTPNRAGWNAGIAYDWMLNKNFGVFAVNPDFDQIRGQFGYRIKGGNEIGFWGTYGIQTDHEKSQNIPLRFRGISQVNLFWNHTFKTHGYGMLWVGTPYDAA